MKYVVYFTWKWNGEKDSFNVDSARERNMNIDEMIEREEFESISYCPIYRDGEYGKRINVYNSVN